FNVAVRRTWSSRWLRSSRACQVSPHCYLGMSSSPAPHPASEWAAPRRDSSNPVTKWKRQSRESVRSDRGLSSAIQGQCVPSVLVRSAVCLAHTGHLKKGGEHTWKLSQGI